MQKKNIYWYNIFNSILIPISKVIKDTDKKIQELPFYISSGSIQLIFKDCRLKMQKGFIRFGVINSNNNLNCGIEIKDDSKEISLIIQNKTLTFNPANIDKLNNILNQTN